MVIRTYLETYDFTGKKIVLFATSSGSGLGRTAEELADSCPGADESHYKTLVQYLNLDDQGIVLGYGCGTVSMTRHSEYPNKAYRFGGGFKIDSLPYVVSLPKNGHLTCADTVYRHDM